MGNHDDFIDFEGYGNRSLSGLLREKKDAVKKDLREYTPTGRRRKACRETDLERSIRWRESMSSGEW